MEENEIESMKTEQRGEKKCITLHIFLLSPFSAEPCLPARTLTVTHVPNPRRGLSRVLCIMKVDISPHISRPGDVNCSSVWQLVHLTRQHK